MTLNSTLTGLKQLHLGSIYQPEMPPLDLNALLPMLQTTLLELSLTDVEGLSDLRPVAILTALEVGGTRDRSLVHYCGGTSSIPGDLVDDS